MLNLFFFSSIHQLIPNFLNHLTGDMKMTSKSGNLNSHIFILLS